VQLLRRRGGIVLECHGEITRDELIGIRSTLEGHSVDLRRLKFLMIDLTEAVLAELTTADLQELARLVQKSQRICRSEW
jgi:hypothetical protein